MQDEACDSIGTAPSAAQAPDDAPDGPPRLLVHNLFALEAYHVAQARETCESWRPGEVLPCSSPRSAQTVDTCPADCATQMTRVEQIQLHAHTNL